MAISVEQREMLHDRIRDWTIDADTDHNVGTNILVRDTDAEALRKGQRPFIVGKKGTGKTGIAKNLCQRFPKDFRYELFADLFDEYTFILSRLNVSDPTLNVRVLAFKGAILRRAIKQISVRELGESKWVSAETRTRVLTEPSWLDKLLFVASRSKISKDGIEAGLPESSAATPKISVAMLQDRVDDVLKILSTARRIPKAFFFDSVDEAAEFRSDITGKSDELKALIHAFFRLGLQRSQTGKGPSFVLLLRPDYLQVAEADIMRKAHEQALKLEWSPSKLREVIQFRLLADQNQLKHSSPQGIGDLFQPVTSPQEDHISYMMNYSFGRPRDLLNFVRYASQHAATVEKDQFVSVNNVITKIPLQRDDLFAESIATLSFAYGATSAREVLRSLASAPERSLSRIQFEAHIRATTGLEPEACVAHLYNSNAIAIGRGATAVWAEASRINEVPAGGEVTVHWAFRSRRPRWDNTPDDDVE